MADITPASPTLQGIPPELRNKIYDHLALTTPRNVFGHKLLELRKFPRDRSFGLWKQSQLATAVHPLTMTCRQMRTEFNSVLATTVGQNYCLIVDNFDSDQFVLFCEFIAKHCFSYRVSDKNLPPLLFNEVMLCIKMSTRTLASIEAYGWAALVHPRGDYGVITGDFSEITMRPEPRFSFFDKWEYPFRRRESESERQAEPVKDILRPICDAYERFEPDERVRRLLITHQNEELDNRWLTTDERIEKEFVAYFAARNNASLPAATTQLS
ncbi:hypothetical protein Q7P35_009608 [Cladosporium inversicolor]